ncbi:MAG TPA: hypothetical protein VLA13_03490 [Massilibacterium sp.]|nr:hypothetical protein [Massilibacterium sp.]
MKDGRYFNVGGEICQNCNRMYKTIYHMPDDIWQEITGKEDGSGLLCIECADQLARVKGYKLLWKPELHEVYS